MIVLDEQLLGRNLENEIGRWYQGAVRFIIDLRPNTVIKDDAIPGLLQQERQPTFVTINERDFWRKVQPSNSYCLVCFTLPDSRVNEIAQGLRELFQHTDFNTKSKRMGKIIRVTDRVVTYYTVNLKQIQTVDFYS
jgi:hypothetical protein